MFGVIKAYEQVGVPLVQETKKHCCVGPHKTRVGELGVTSIAATDATWNSMIGANLLREDPGYGITTWSESPCPGKAYTNARGVPLLALCIISVKLETPLYILCLSHYNYIIFT